MEDNKGVGWEGKSDPTELTTQSLLHEVAVLKEYLEVRLDGQVNSIKVRLDAMDTAISVLAEGAARSPTVAVVDANVKRLEDVTNEKFAGVEQKFTDFNAKIDQASIKDAKAVDAAFSAQKEAVGEQNKSNALAIAKSEAAFTKQIDQSIQMITANAKVTDDKFEDVRNRLALTFKGAEDKIEDLRTRVTLTEGRSTGMANGWGYLVAGIGLLVAVLTLVAVVVSVYIKVGNP